MSRYRQIHCLIWNDNKFPFCSDDCQLVFFHLMTTPLTTPFGLFKASLEALAAEKRWSFEKYRKAFGEASDNGFVKYDARHHVFLIPKFMKYNPPNNPNVVIKWGSIYEEIPDCQLKSEFYQNIKALCEGYGEAFGKAFGKAFAKSISTQEQDKEQEQDIYGQSFNTFWQAYPRKVARNKSLQIWAKLRPDDELLKMILNALEKQKQCKEWRKDGGQYIPHPATWLRGRRWEDEVPLKEEKDVWAHLRE